MTPQYLSALDVIAMNDELLRRAGEASSPVRDAGALEGALMRPQMAAYYEQADLITQTTVLMAGVALAHPFLDGNKRTALAAGTTFCFLNGYQIVSEPTELGRQIEAIVVRADSLENATARFIAWLRPRFQAIDA
ncbi:MAG TPA: type II toxin-antitoxin system death-on-curing family toxin [Ktedonobacterales bacterium]|nr:type II toxin-antitoxin system death-on-curing family toxin [Ktedonobacterales bacterium]